MVKNMASEEIRKKIEKLKETINYHRYLYHVLDKQEISEAALDSLKHELYLLEQQYPELITLDSPTQRVEGKVLDKFEKVEHTSRMLSLNDVFSFEELKDWESRLKKVVPGIKTDFYAEVKMDGLAVSLIYNNCLLEKAATRGDGKVGEDVTNNIRTIESIPTKLRIDDLDEREKILIQSRIEIRGEVYMTKKEFELANKKQRIAGGTPYANPRNLAAGSIRQLDQKVAASRKLAFMGYDIVSDLGQQKHSQTHELLKKIGFPSNPNNRLCANLQDVEKYFQEIGKKRDKLPYQIDGVVVVVDELKFYDRLGVVGKAPRYMAAYKFPAEQVVSKILQIEVQVGRTGAITPVAIMEPVNVAGSVVSRATLHNFEEITNKGIRIGDTVVIQKAGDVIPEVVQVLTKMRDGSEKVFRKPKVCPACGGGLVQKAGEKIMRCVNRTCFAMIRRGISHFVSKNAFNIDGLGRKIIDQLVDNGLINNVADIFSLTKGDLEPLERFAEKSAENVINAINKSKKISFDKFIYALGIRHVGQQMAYDLAKFFGKIERFMRTNLDELNSIEGIGDVVAESIVSYIGDEKNIEIINKLLSAGVKIYLKKAVDKLAGKVFVITGTMQNNSRDSIKQLIKDNGGRVSSSISTKTDFLIAGDNPGSKFKKAKELGVKVINENTFLDMVK